MEKLQFPGTQHSPLGTQEVNQKPSPCKACGNPFDDSFPIRYTSAGVEVRTLCRPCLDKEYAEQDIEKTEDERRAARRKSFVEEHGWEPPVKFYEASLGGFDANLQPKAYALVQKFLDKPGKGILLYGPPGIGKTHLASAAFNHFYDQWDAKKRPFPMARFVREHDFFTRIRATFGKNTRQYGDEQPENEASIIQEYSNMGILILDDLCKYTPADTSFRNRVYYELFDGLWNNQASLILTSNIGPEALEAELGAPITDRIRDLCVLCEMKGVSQRGKR